MILTATLIAMAGGALIGGAKAYRRRKRVVRLGPSPSAPKPGATGAPPPPGNGRAGKTLKKVSLGVRTFFLEETRHRQIQELEGRGDSLITARKQMNRRFSFASANLAVASLSLFFPLLIIPSVAMLVYVAFPFYKLAYKAAVEERRVSSYVIDTILITGILLKGLIFLGALDVWAMTLGRKWLLKSEHNSKKHLLNLFDERPPAVWVLTDNDVEIEVPFADLKCGDIVVVGAGQVIPVDGIIAKGVVSIDQYKLTGESQPIEKGGNDHVLASTVVLSGRIHIRAERTGEETVAMKIGDVLNSTAEYKNSIQSRGEAIADKLVLPTLGASILALPFLGVGSALAVLTNTFGYKMRLFGPASMLTFLNIASQQGVLVKDGRSLELLNKVDTVVFDKTGTLTTDQPTVGRLHACNGVCEQELLAYAAAAEAGQTHPVAKAILAAAAECELEGPTIESAEYKIGYGIQVTIADRIIRVGSGKFIALEGISVPPEIAEIQRACLDKGNSPVMVAVNEQVAGVIELHATIRPEAKRLIGHLHQRGIATHIISGDHEAPTRSLARDLNIAHYSANILPEHKAALVRQLQETGFSQNLRLYPDTWRQQ